MMFHDAQPRSYAKYRPVDPHEDDDDILKDGEFIRVPLVAMDADDQPSYPLAPEPAMGQWIDAPKQPHYPFRDTLGRPAGNRPSFIFSDVDQSAVDAAWERKGKRLRDAWKHVPSVVVSPEPKPQSQPNRDQSPAQARAAADAAWEARRAQDRDAWKQTA